MQRVGDVFEWKRVEIDGGFRIYAWPKESDNITRPELPVYILTTTIRGDMLTGNKRIRHSLDYRHRDDIDRMRETGEFEPEYELPGYVRVYYEESDI